MLNVIDWQQTVHDPRFWAVRYNGRFPEVTREALLEYFSDFYNLEELEDDPLARYLGEGDDPQPTEIEAKKEIGWRILSFSFPEDYHWRMELTTEDGHAAGKYHSLVHPSLYPKGIVLAEEGGHERLPGLRWAELKQVATCLIQNGFDAFDVGAIVPLLYPVVKFVTFNELEEVRQTLATAWQELQVLDVAQTAQWLDQIITVYDKGQILRIDSQKKWKPTPWRLGYDGALWTQTEEGWKTLHHTSMRNIKKDTHHFLPFFSMLERYS